jgi:hypothetical protein
MLSMVQRLRIFLSTRCLTDEEFLMAKVISFTLLTLLFCATVHAQSESGVQTRPESFDGPDGKGAQLLSEGGAGAESGKEDKAQRLKAQLSADLKRDSTLDKLESYLWK